MGPGYILQPGITVLRNLVWLHLEQEDELGEPLDGLHHQTEEVQPVVGCDLLHLKVGG